VCVCVRTRALIVVVAVVEVVVGKQDAKKVRRGCSTAFR
jgi:hypothetical protein